MKAVAYVATALSTDSRMGEDSVVECVQRDGTVNMYTSFTENDYGGALRHPVKILIGFNFSQQYL